MLPGREGVPVGERLVEIAVGAALGLVEAVEHVVGVAAVEVGEQPRHQAAGQLVFAGGAEAEAQQRLHVVVGLAAGPPRAVDGRQRAVERVASAGGGWPPRR